MIIKIIKGAMMTLRGINPNLDITVRITKDKRGKSLSLTNEELGIMLMVPLEPIEKELAEALKNDR